MTSPLLLSSLCVLALAAPQDDRRPAPDAAAQAAFEKTVKEVFKTEYLKRSAADVVSLARKLLQQGRETTDDPTGRYVLLREARDLAAQGGDLATALAAIDELAKTYAVDAVELSTAALTTVGKTAKGPEALEALANGCLSLAEKALATDRYDDASALLVKAENAAKGAQNIPMVTRVQALRKDVADLQKERQRVKSAEKTLVDQPDDPAANLALGRFLCLTKKDWSRGIPLLAKGSDPALQAVALKELAAPSTFAAQVEVGDGWWDLGEKQKDLATRRKFVNRARHWYELGLAGVTGLAKAKVEKRLDEIEKLNASGPIVDLLALIDPKKDATSGVWDKKDSALWSPVPVAQASLQVPYLPPLEYDLKMVVEKRDIHVLHIGLPTGDVRVEVDLDNQSTWGNLNFPQPSGKNSVVKYNTSYTQRNKPSVLICSVRRTGAWVTVDGKVVLSWEGDVGTAIAVPAWRPPNPKAISLGSWGSWIISRMMLIPVTGQGKPLR